ncbi:hypothetical protein PG984_007727 [Apiospora sp. TS-2023a]
MDDLTQNMPNALEEEPVSSICENSRRLPSSGLAQSGYPTDPHLLRDLQWHYQTDPSFFILRAAGRNFTMPRKVSCYHSDYLEREVRKVEFGTKENSFIPIVRLPMKIPIAESILVWFVKIIYRLDRKHYRVQYTDDIFGPGDTQIERLMDLYMLDDLADLLECPLIRSSAPRAIGKIMRQLRVSQDTDDELQLTVRRFNNAYILWAEDIDTVHKILDAFCRLVDFRRAMSVPPTTEPRLPTMTDGFRKIVFAHWQNMQTEPGTNPEQHSTAASGEMEGNSEETAQGS